MKIFAPYFLFFFITIQAQVGKEIASLDIASQPKNSTELNGFFHLKPFRTSTQSVLGNDFSSTTPKGELRGVFLPSVSSLSWPTNRKATPAVQQAELITILDDLKANGYNTVFLQVRS